MATDLIGWLGDEHELGLLLFGQIESVQFKAYEEIQNQISIEYTASMTEEQRNTLKILKDNARASIKQEGTSLIFNLYFTNIPKEAKSYAELIASNAKSIIELSIKDYVSDRMKFGEAREILYQKVKDWAIDQTHKAFGGI